MTIPKKTGTPVTTDPEGLGEAGDPGLGSPAVTQEDGEAGIDERDVHATKGDPGIGAPGVAQEDDSMDP